MEYPSFDHVAIGYEHAIWRDEKACFSLQRLIVLAQNGQFDYRALSRIRALSGTTS
jgi:hypothetical protein